MAVTPTSIQESQLTTQDVPMNAGIAGGLIALASIVVSTPEAQGFANLLVNGDFEEPIVTNPAGWTVYPAGSSFPGWTVESGSIDIVRIVIPDFGDAWSAASGYQSVDLNGFEPGCLYQDLTTQAGSIYYISFALAGNVVGPPVTVSMDFLWSGTVLDSLVFDTTNHDGYNVGWTYFQYAVEAPPNATVTRLKFESLTEFSSRGPAIDDISVSLAPRDSIPVEFLVTRPMPDPGSTLVMLAGTAAVLPFSFRRRLFAVA